MNVDLIKLRIKMEIIRTYQQLMTHNKKYSYIQSDGKIVFNQNWAWIIVFQALNKINYATVKYDSGKYTVIKV